MNLREQQAKAWSLAPDCARKVQQLSGGGWHYLPIKLGVWRYLYQGIVGNWHWRDTLQSREEFEAMNKQDEFQREERYVVLKLKRMSDNQKAKLAEFLRHTSVGRHQTECVVVESDWPIYEQAWHLVEQLWQRENNVSTQELADEWMPEVGQECESYPYFHNCVAVCEYEGDILMHDRHDDVYFKAGNTKFRPTQPEADKYRDEQEKFLCSIIGSIGLQGFDEPKKYAAPMMYEQGVRVLFHDERICKPLTDEQREELKKLFFLEAISQDPDAFIDAVLREVGLIEEK